MSKIINANKGSTALASAKEYVAGVLPRIQKAAKALATTESMTAEQLASAVKAFRKTATAATTHRSAVRSELRAAVRTAADGDEISDEYKDTSESLIEIVNLAETALDSLGEDTEVSKEASDESNAVAAEDNNADHLAGEADNQAAEDNNADHLAGDADADVAATLAAEEKEAAASKTAARRRAGKKRTAEEALDLLVEGLQDLISEVQEISGDNETVVNLDENGVVQDDDSVRDVIEEDPAPITDDDDDINASIASLLAGDEDATNTASSDPYNGGNKDPLAGKGAIRAQQQQRREAANRGASQFDKDLANLEAITSALVR